MGNIYRATSPQRTEHDGLQNHLTLEHLPTPSSVYLGKWTVENFCTEKEECGLEPNLLCSATAANVKYHSSVNVITPPPRLSMHVSINLKQWGETSTQRALRRSVGISRRKLLPIVVTRSWQGRFWKPGTCSNRLIVLTQGWALLYWSLTQSQTNKGLQVVMLIIHQKKKNLNRRKLQTTLVIF